MNEIEIKCVINEDGTFTITSVFDKRDTVLNTLIVLEQTAKALRNRVFEAYKEDFHGLNEHQAEKELKRLLDTIKIADIHE